MNQTLSSRLADLRVVAAVLAAVLLVRTVAFEPFTIPSASMEPGLLVGDYLIASKSAYGWSRYSLPFGLPLFHGRILGRTPQRGDVVVFRLPRDPRVTYVKRVIGLPGDTVAVVAGRVVVNGAALTQNPLGPMRDPDTSGLVVQAAREGDHVVLDRGARREGDERPVVTVPPDALFVMGDNRDNSLDSRWPAAVGVGFVPMENLVGKARLVIGSARPDAALLRPWTWLRWDRFLRPV